MSQGYSLIKSGIQEIRKRKSVPNHVCRHCRTIPISSHAFGYRFEEYDRNGWIGYRFSSKELY
jgi:hypothetical protein